MTIAALAIFVAIAAAVRSTWSPCGRSMFSSITPLAERGRGHRFRATASWFVVGSAAGGASLGAVVASLAGVVRRVGLSGSGAAIVALAGAAVVALSDSGVVGSLLPVHHRQVNERWLDQFRPWAYGAGFGLQIGCGLATYVRTGAVYLMILLGVVSGRPVAALAACLAFGTVRGLAVLLGRRIRNPAELQAFHRRFAALERPVAGATVVADLTALGVLAAVAWSAAWPWAAAVLAATGVGAVIVRDTRRSCRATPRYRGTATSPPS